MEWILKNLPLLVFLWVAFSIIRTALKARSAGAENPEGEDETEEQRRVREIRERIRRRIEDRADGQASDSQLPPVIQPGGFERSESEVSTPPQPPRLPEGNLMRRALSELERRLPMEPPELVPPSRFEANLEFERQAALAEELEALEEARRLAQRRALQRVAAAEAIATSAPARHAAARSRLMQDLRDPQSLRRAFILREVLGPPVGLR